MSDKSLLVKESKPADCLNLLLSVTAEWTVVNVAYMHFPEEAYVRSFFPCFAYVVLASVDEIFSSISTWP